MTIKEALEKYKLNMDKLVSLDEPLHQEMSFEEWEAYMKKRSVLLYECTSEDNDLLSFITEYLKNPLKEEEVPMLEEEFSAFYHSAQIDIAVIRPLAEALLDFYERKKNRERVMIYLYRLDMCINNYLTAKCADKIDYTYSDRIRQYIREVKNLTTKECSVIVQCYFNLMLVYPESIKTDKKENGEKIYKVYLEYNNEFLPFVRENQRDENFEDYNNIIRTAAVSYFVDPELFSEDIVEIYIPVVEEMYQENLCQVSHGYEVDENLLIGHFVGMLYKNEMNPDELLEQAFQLYCDNPMNSPEGNTKFECVAFNNSNLITHIAKYAQNKQRVSEIVKKVGKTVTSSALAYVKFDYSVANILLYLWTSQNLKYIDSENKVDIILNNIVKSQPATYIHSKMVKRISVLLLNEFYRERPELFKSLPMTFDEMTDYIGNAAVLHDIGKIAISEIITTQSRKLLDEEFKGIQRHPELGIQLLEENPELLIYKDPVLYHHKWYNGEGGYPEGKANISSPYRIITDIITLADCLDAATDNLGRCYKKSKNAYDVLAEFKAYKGVKYNPDLVTLLDENKALMEELNRITGKERSQMMYLQYQDSLELEKKQG